MECVRQFAAAGNHAQDFSTTRLRGLKALQHKCSGAFRHRLAVDRAELKDAVGRHVAVGIAEIPRRRHRV